MSFVIPKSAADDPTDLKLGDQETVQPPFGTAYIKNPCFAHEMLTFDEAMMCIQRLSGIIIADRTERRG